MRKTVPQCIHNNNNNKRYTALKVRRQCPFVLLVKVAGNKIERWAVKRVACWTVDW